MPPTSTTLLTPSEVRQRLRVSEATIWRLRKAGQFPAPVKLCAQRIAWRATDIEQWIDTRTLDAKAVEVEHA